MRGILSKGESNFAQVDRFLRKEIVTDKSYANTLEEFSSKELSALILGAFFGLIFQKMINDEGFTNPDETSVTIQKFIKYLKIRRNYHEQRIWNQQMGRRKDHLQ